MTTGAGFRWDRLSFGLAVAAWVATAILFHSVWSFPFTPIVVAIPVVVSGIPLIVPPSAKRTARIAAVFLLFALVLLGVFSVGFLFLPGLITMIVAASRQEDAGEDPRGGRTRAEGGGSRRTRPPPSGGLPSQI